MVNSNRLVVIVYDSGTQILNEASVSTFSLSDWHLFALCFNWNDSTKQTAVNLYVDDVANGSFAFDGILIDDATCTKMIGAENDIANSLTTKSGFFTGFIFSVCITQHCKSSFADEIKDTSCEPTTNCQTCPETYCLIDCDIDEFFEDGTCQDCH
jgi:hypothetical protein